MTDSQMHPEDYRAAKEELEEIEDPNELNRSRDELIEKAAMLEDMADELARGRQNLYCENNGALGDASVSAEFATRQAEADLRDTAEDLKNLANEVEEK